MTPATGRWGRFPLLVSLVSLLLTLAIGEAIWESYFPDANGESLRRRREHYEEILLKSNLSWREALYYKKIDTPGKKP